MIRPIYRDDLDRVARLHSDYMDDSVFAQLGKRFLYLLYQGTISSYQGIGYVYVKDEQVMGFITATTHTTRLFKEILLKAGYKLIPLILLQIFKNPRVIGEVFQTFFYFNRASLRSVKAELLFISIEPHQRGREIARELIERVLSDMRQRKISRVKVTTVKNNIVVNQLLKSLGFYLERSFNLYGKVMQLYSYNLEASESQ